MKEPGPIFALAPAPIDRHDCAVSGAAFTLATWGIILAREGMALSLRLDPTAMIAIGTLVARAGQALGGDAVAAMEQLQSLPVVDLPGLAGSAEARDVH